MNDSLEFVRFLLRYPVRIKELAEWTAATHFFLKFCIYYYFKRIFIKINNIYIAGNCPYHSLLNFLDSLQVTSLVSFITEEEKIIFRQSISGRFPRIKEFTRRSIDGCRKNGECKAPVDRILIPKALKLSIAALVTAIVANEIHL